MTGVDWTILVAVLVSMALAAKEGFFYEIFSLAGVVIGYLAAAWEYGRVAARFSPYTKAEWVADVAGFLVIFVAVVLLAGVIGRTVRWAMREAGLRWVDRILGAGFGLLRGVLIVAVLLLALASFTPGSRLLAGSALGPYFLAVARAAAWVAPSSLRMRLQQGVQALQEFGPGSGTQFVQGSAQK